MGSMCYFLYTFPLSNNSYEMADYSFFQRPGPQLLRCPEASVDFAVPLLGQAEGAVDKAF